MSRPADNPFSLPRKAANVALFNAGWFACVLGAAWDRPWLGPAAVAAVLAVHLTLRPGPGGRGAEAACVGACVLVGLLADSAVIAGGAFAPKRWTLPSPLPSVWLLAMWANFAPLLTVSLRWLRGRWALAAGLGAIGGPSAYYSGQQLGALTIGRPTWLAVGILAVGWALVVPALTGLSAALDRARPGGRS